MRAAPGVRLNGYELLRPLGVGGMGEVWVARDLALRRTVALKLLPPDLTENSGRVARFEHEARAASALSHPNICQVHVLGRTLDGQRYIVMELVEGVTLRARLEESRLSVPESLAIASQIAAGIAAAHATGIIHRDLKPENVMLRADGLVKVLDFGLAKLVLSDAGIPGNQSTHTMLRTDVGKVLGTVAYMSPEQARGLPLDERTDVWSLGVMLHEMVAARRPFEGETSSDVLASILDRDPSPLSRSAPDAPTELERIVTKALKKDRALRYQTMRDCALDLEALKEGLHVNKQSGRKTNRSRSARVITLALSLLLVAGGSIVAWRLHRESRITWAREVALPEIRRMVQSERFVPAFDLASEAAHEIPNDPELLKQLAVATRTLSIESSPSRARIFYQEYGANADSWRDIGVTPIAAVQVPSTVLRWKAELAGFSAAEDLAPADSDHLRFVLPRPGDVPAGMVIAALGSQPFYLIVPGLSPWPHAVLGDFLIDRHEVTNREFQRFVDAHGYDRPEFWREPFVADGRPLTRPEAMARFVDATGHPGPALWEVGHYSVGDGDLPVTGVSWYEAAAYAVFVGKALPTLFHWSAVAEPAFAPWIVPVSNLGGRGLRAVGNSAAFNRFGATDLAGNAKEWVWNAGGAGTRYVAGGAWNEPAYMFTDIVDTRSPFAREANFGFRCMKLLNATAVPAATVAPIVLSFRDFSGQRPVSNETFRAYRSLYSYDRTPLAMRVESVDDTSVDWRLENVTFAAAYGNERITAHLYLPKHGHGPYQTLIEFPGNDAFYEHQFDPDLEHNIFRFVVQSGRALMVPTYKGTYERRSTIPDGFPTMTVAYRDHAVMWVKDMARSLDYLESRPDIEKAKIGYVGVSWGGTFGPIILASEPRLKVAVFVGGGFLMQQALPEADAVNFAPRVSTPVLMINGRLDFVLSPRDSQEPLFRSLGTPPNLKQRVVFDTGHFPHYADIARESLQWLDRFLGPVKQDTGAGP
jgi:serine/threonine protein kinase/cephalosporin-C deacetylase-like acetyl esterase